jgi:hypothetical protein
MKNIICLVLLISLVLSCEKTINLDLNQTESILVIEGLLTNQPGRQFVKLSKTVGFNDAGAPPAVSGAVVYVERPGKNPVNYKEESPGYYVPEEDFTGEVGNEYTLYVESEGTTYTATEAMYHVPPFDSLSVRLNEDELEDPDEEGYFYEVLFYIKEPQQTTDYYLLKVLRNDTIQNWDGEGIFYTDDTFLSGNIQGFPTPIFFAERDMATVEMYSISRDGYVYFLDLDENINSDGGMFDGRPANVRSNVKGGAVGYFQVSALATDNIRVLE